MTVRSIYSGRSSFCVIRIWFKFQHASSHKTCQACEAHGDGKGVRLVLMERAIWPGEGLTLDDARALLASQPNFASQRMWLQETSESRGSLIILYPKFYPEFNWIEMYWGECKRYSRKHCTYRFKDLIQILPDALRSPSLATMRRFAQKSFRYMDAYREKNGQFLTTTQVEHAVRKYLGHKTIPASIMANWL